MAKHNNEKKTNNNDKFDYKGYVANLGKPAIFFTDSKDSKGVEGTLTCIAEKGVYGKIKGDIFPRLFARAEFGSTATFKLNGKNYKIVEVNGDNKDKDSKGSKGDSYGVFSDNGKEKAKKLIAMKKAFDELDFDDDDDYKKAVDMGNNFGKLFKK